jgi:hypothetical protein
MAHSGGTGFSREGALTDAEDAPDELARESAAVSAALHSRGTGFSRENPLTDAEDVPDDLASSRLKRSAARPVPRQADRYRCLALLVSSYEAGGIS